MTKLQGDERKFDMLQFWSRSRVWQTDGRPDGHSGRSIFRTVTA